MTSQAILSIDCTLDPAWFQVVEVDGRSVKVLESLQADLKGAFSPSVVRTLSGQNGTQEIPFAQEVSTLPQSPDPTVDALPPSDGDASGTSSVMSPEGSGTNPQTISDYGTLLRAALDQIKTPYTAAVLIVPPTDYLSLNLDLPFGDAKQVSKILDLEVQDRVPFEIEEFLVEYRTLGKLRAGPHDVHVSIIPKTALRSIMHICKTAQFEPLIVTTPASILEGIFHLGPDYFRSDAAMLLWRDSRVYVALRFDGRVRVDRVIDLTHLEGSPEARLKALSTELRLTFLSSETRYERPIEHVYVVGSSAHESYFSSRDLQQFLGREVEDVALQDFISAESDQASLASVAGPFAQDVEPPPILTNFRTKEFSYSLQLSEVFAGVRRLGPMMLIALLSFIVYLAGYYYYRELQISGMQDSMRVEIQRLLPGVAFEPGQEVGPIQAENTKLDKALESLGSGSLDTYTALDLLKEISALMPNKAGLITRSISIRGNRIRLQGTAQSYGDVEAIERALQRSKTIKFRAKPPEISGASGSTPGGAKSAQNFSFDIRVED